MEPGTVFDKYAIRSQLGRGGMGIVYLAEDTTLMRLVALKVLDRDITASPHFKQRFLQEARTIASLKHPNIVPIHALSHIGDHWVIEMPYIEGGSLMEAEARAGLEVRGILKCMRDILLALAACHESGIIHRDVKPSNILLGEQSRGMLSDFGLAKLLSLRQQDGVQTSCSASLFIGTPRYAPPESWEEQDPTPAWDIYSVGMVLYEAISGNTPYDAQTPLSLMKQLLERPVPPLKESVSSVSVNLSDLVSAMLRRNPSERPQDVADILESFWSLPELSGDSPSRPVLVKQRPRGKAVPGIEKRPAALIAANRKRAFAAGGVMLIALLAAGIGFFLLFARLQDMPAFSRSRQQTPAAVPEMGGSETLIAFDSVDMQTQETLTGYCLGRIQNEDQPWRLVAAGPEHLWFLEVAEQPANLLEIYGHWADYDHESAMIFRHGTFSGKGRWVRGDGDMSVSLTFEYPETAATWNHSILFKRVSPPPSGVPFLCALARAESVSALVYNEILPRNLPWAGALEDFFVDLGLLKMNVPENTPEAKPIILDGNLQETTWNLYLNNATGKPSRAFPVIGPPDSLLHARHDAEALYLGLHVETEIDKPSLLIALQTEHTIPAVHASRRIVQAEGGEIVTAELLHAGASAPWTCDWEIVQQLQEGVLEAEIKIPFAGLGRMAAPGPGERWLLNCQAVQARPNGKDVLAQWGDDAVENTPCGLVLIFDH